MNPKTKNNLKKICFVMDISEESGIAFCIDTVFQDVFSILHHAKKRLSENQKMSLDEALSRPPEELTKKSIEAGKNMLANIEKIQEARDRDTWPSNLEGLEG